LTSYLLADPGLSRRTAGEEFVRVVMTSTDDDVTVRLAVSLPTTFPLAQHRPRYTVRHLLKTATVPDGPVSYVSEARPLDAPDSAGTTYASTPEATFVPDLVTAELTDVVAEVALPTGLTRDPALLAAFVDHRLIVRLCTVENEALLQGSADKAVTGLLHLPGLRVRTADGALAPALRRAAAEVEEMGGSCDAIVTHPERYWEMVADGTLANLNGVGLRVSRTRMINRDQLLFGDFRAGVTLLETGLSTLRLRRGAGPAGSDVATAGIRLGLAVHLPQHFLLLDLP
jgi:hypothetical protein